MDKRDRKLTKNLVFTKFSDKKTLFKKNLWYNVSHRHKNVKEKRKQRCFMKKTNKLFALAGVTLLSASVLAACGAKSSSDSQEQKTTFAQEVTNEGTPIKGGQLNYAVVETTPHTGILIGELADQAVDMSFVSMVDVSMFESDENLKLSDTGLAKADFDIENKKVTVSLTGKDYKWSDGAPFTIDDYIFTIEKMADQDYTGSRFGEGYLNIVGMEEFQAGSADSISGIKKVDDYTVELTVKVMSPSLMYAGGDVPSYVMPKHIYKDIPVKDWESSEYSRTAKTVGMGAWKVKEIISGESITFVANEHYFKGKPKLDSVKMDIVSPDTIVSEMKAGNYDIASMPSDQLDSFKDLSNIDVLGSLDNAYYYFSFNLGTYDAEAEKNVMNPDAKMANVNLRQALGYALDNAQVGEKLYSGLLRPANSLIISFFGDLHDSELPGYTYDPEKAKKLLDEAGYKDVDGDGLREDPKGKELKIVAAVPNRGATFDSLIQQYQAWWKEVGLNVELYGGRTMDKGAFYELAQANNPEVDIFVGAWGTGYDPNPTGLWGPKAPYNFTRFVSDENTKLLEAISSEASFDEETNLKNYKAWQKYAFEQAFAIPTFETESLTAINKRVKYYDTYTGSDKVGWDKLELVAEKGVVAE